MGRKDSERRFRPVVKRGKREGSLREQRGAPQGRDDVERKKEEGGSSSLN